MKKLILVFSVLALLFAGCEKDEDDINVELQEGRYHLTDDPNDYVKHYVYEFNQKYGTIFIVNPELQDYKYNFMSEVKVTLVPPVQEESIIKSGIEMFEELFLSKYDEEFKKNFLPFKIELCDTIKYKPGSRWNYYDTYTSHGFIAMSNVNADLAEMSESDKEKIQLELHLDFWDKFLAGARNAIPIPNSFFDISNDYYSQSPDPTPESKEELVEMMHDAGFIDYPGSESSSYKYTQYPDEYEDVRCFFKSMMTMPKEDLQELLEANLKVKTKYEILKTVIKENLNFDITTFPIEDLNK